MIIKDEVFFVTFYNIECGQRQMLKKRNGAMCLDISFLARYEQGENIVLESR